jgi:hypothetical protein
MPIAAQINETTRIRFPTLLRASRQAGQGSASRRLAEDHACHKTPDLHERIYGMPPVRNPASNLRKPGRREQLYNWLSAMMRR